MNTEPSAELIAAIDAVEPAFPLTPQMVPLAVEAADHFMHALGLTEMHAELWAGIDHNEPMTSDVTQAWAEGAMLRLKTWLREHGIPKLSLTFHSRIVGGLVEWELSGCNSERG